MSLEMLKYLERKPKNDAFPRKKLIFLLHGYGSNMHDLFGFSEQLPDDAYVISFNAPLNTIYGGSAWYNLNYNSSGLRFDINEILHSKEIIEQNIRTIISEKEIKTNDITLIGFSQGAIMSYILAADYPELITRIMAFSGYLLNEYKPEEKISNLGKSDIFISHGIFDSVIPIEMARSTKEALINNKINFTYKEYNMEHGISPECLSDALNWLTNSYQKNGGNNVGH